MSGGSTSRAEEERGTETPPLALVIDASRKFKQRNDTSYVKAMHREAAYEIIDDTIYVLSLLEAHAYIDDETTLLTRMPYPDWRACWGY